MAKSNIVISHALCLIRIDKTDRLPEEEFELTDAQLKSPGVRYLFNRGELAFVDDAKRNREFLAEIRKGAKKAKEKTLEELEEGATIK
ncbi:DUF7444 family protein [Hafnia sp.]